MPEFAAALLLRSRHEADQQAEVRRNAAEAWTRALGTTPGLRTIRVTPGAEPGYLRFPMRLRRGLAALRDSTLAVRLGIAPVYPHALGRLRALRPLIAGGGRTTYPCADGLCRELVTLPTHSRVLPRERSAILALLAEGRLHEPGNRNDLEPPATVETAH
jgi:dTDP-4-amino-4,6-dideoxygalactose transaminase